MHKCALVHKVVHQGTACEQHDRPLAAGSQRPRERKKQEPWPVRSPLRGISIALLCGVDTT